MNPLRLLVLLVSLPLLLGGCGGEKSVNMEELVERQGIWYLVNSEKPFTGKSVSLHANGQKYLERNYKDGKQEGLDVCWWYNGQRQIEVNYKDGNKVEGSEKYWTSKGEPVDTLGEAIK